MIMPQTAFSLFKASFSEFLTHLAKQKVIAVVVKIVTGTSVTVGTNIPHQLPAL